MKPLVRHALVCLAAALAVVLAGAAWIGSTWHLSYTHALYCTAGFAATEGCDTEPRSNTGRWVALLVWVLAIPLLAAAYQSLHIHRSRKHAGRQSDEGER